MQFASSRPFCRSHILAISWPYLFGFNPILYPFSLRKDVRRKNSINIAPYSCVRDLRPGTQGDPLTHWAIPPQICFVFCLFPTSNSYAGGRYVNGKRGFSGFPTCRGNVKRGLPFTTIGANC